MTDDRRFEIVYKQGIASGIRIIVDRQTGVNYLFASEGYGGGITPLLDSEGNAVITDWSASPTEPENPRRGRFF